MSVMQLHDKNAVVHGAGGAIGGAIAGAFARELATLFLACVAPWTRPGQVEHWSEFERGGHSLPWRFPTNLSASVGPSADRDEPGGVGWRNNS